MLYVRYYPSKDIFIIRNGQNKIVRIYKSPYEVMAFQDSLPFGVELREMKVRDND